MTRTLLAVALVLGSAAPALADANLIVIDGSDKNVKPADFGYTVRTIVVGKKVEIYLELTANAAKAFGHGELHLTKGGQTVVEAKVTIQKDQAGTGVLKIALDPRAVDGGELEVWSGHIEGAPPVRNFGGFRLSIATLLAEPKDADALMKAMDGFRKELPPPVGLGEMNGLGVADINGKTHPDTHLAGIGARLEIKTRAECLVLMTYLKDPDPKIRRIAAFAIKGLVKAYPNGMSSQDIQDVTSDGHRAMVKAFLAAIDKLPR
jgi:hypothetical protein